MRLVTYRRNVLESARLGALVDNMVVDVEYLGMVAGIDLPNDMLDFIDLGPAAVATPTALLNAHKQSWPVGVAQPLQNVTLLAPIPRPRKNIFGIGLNYVERVEESSRSLDTSPDLPRQPVIFTKPPTSVIGPDDASEHNKRITQQHDREVKRAASSGRHSKRSDEKD